MTVWTHTFVPGNARIQNEEKGILIHEMKDETVIPVHTIEGRVQIP